MHTFFSHIEYTFSFSKKNDCKFLPSYTAHEVEAQVMLGPLLQFSTSLLTGPQNCTQNTSVEWKHYQWNKNSYLEKGSAGNTPQVPGCSYDQIPLGRSWEDSLPSRHISVMLEVLSSSSGGASLSIVSLHPCLHLPVWSLSIPRPTSHAVCGWHFGEPSICNSHLTTDHNVLCH